MNTEELLDILSQLKNLIESHFLLDQKKKTRYIDAIDKLESSYNELNIPDLFGDLYESLVKRGKELIRELKKNRNSAELSQKISYYLRYLKASLYDFKGNIKGINSYTRMFLITSALFMLLTPQFYGFILPLLFILPMFAGLKGVKRRSQTGLYMSLSVVPMAFMVSITWFRYFLQVALPNLHQEIANYMSSYGFSHETAQILLVVFGVLSIALLISSLVTAYLGFKYRDMFV